MTIARIASIPATTEYKLAGGVGNTYSGVLAPAVSAPYSKWAQILSNTAATPGIIGDTGQAQYLWYQPSVDPTKIATGETAYFYRRAIITFPLALSVLTTIGAHISVCADNAFLGRVSLIPFILVAGTPVTQDIPDGTLVLSQSLTEVAPYNWQKVYETDVEVSINPLLFAATSLVVEFELEVMNYQAAPIGHTNNPAGFIYNIEIDGLPATSTFANANNANPIAPLS